VGPDLSGVAIKNDRQYLLDSIVEPNKIITKGFGQIKVQTIDGLILTGLLVAETDEEIRLLDAEGQTIVIPADDVDGIKPGLSAMPADLVKSLTQTELRDLIEYLAQRKTPPKPEQAEGHD
jgi:quinoprotein glucose dehydrogenase